MDFFQEEYLPIAVSIGAIVLAAYFLIDFFSQAVKKVLWLSFICTLIFILILLVIKLSKQLEEKNIVYNDTDYVNQIEFQDTLHINIDYIKESFSNLYKWRFTIYDTIRKEILSYIYPNFTPQ
jgi:hypothetical protein